MADSEEAADPTEGKGEVSGLDFCPIPPTDRRHGDLGKTSKEDSSGPKRKDKIYTYRSHNYYRSHNPPYEEGGFPHRLVSLDISSHCARLSQMCSTLW